MTDMTWPDEAGTHRDQREGTDYNVFLSLDAEQVHEYPSTIAAPPLCLGMLNAAIHLSRAIRASYDVIRVTKTVQARVPVICCMLLRKTWGRS